jgi:hypothetical protein
MMANVTLTAVVYVVAQFAAYLQDDMPDVFRSHLNANDYKAMAVLIYRM